MKKDPVVIIVGLILTLIIGLVLVQVARADESADLTAQLNNLGSEFTALKQAREANLRKKSDLDWAAQQLLPKIHEFQTNRANLNRRMDAQQARIDNHNSRCSGTYEDEGYVNACNAEKSQLDSTSSALMDENNNLETIRNLLQQNVQVHDEEEAKVIAKDERELARMQEIMEMAKPIIARLKEIAMENDGCKEAIHQVDLHPDSTAYKERMHAVCGSMFDGN